MSRAIKFRVWDENNKQFADYEDIEECLSCQAMDGWRSSDGMGCCFGINTVEILADCIIEQYTGLKDKNGKEIYEGDIVEYDWYIMSGKPAYRVKEQVIFDDMGARVGNDRIRNCSNVEVIGNIHESPELLGGENEK